MHDKQKILITLLSVTFMGSAGNCLANNDTNRSPFDAGFDITNLCFEPAIIDIVYPVGGPTISARILTPKNVPVNEKKSDKRLTLVSMNDDGKEILIVPENKAYLKLSDISSQAAEQLWGQARLCPDNIKTFDLVQPNGAPIVFRLDTKFTNNKLAAYRVRGVQIPKPEWIQVN